MINYEVPNIFLLQNSKLLEMREQPYDSEDLLQRLLAEHPSILAGDQFNGLRPKRWLLVKREAGIPDAAATADRWSADHLFLDQDGVPTLVERREPRPDPGWLECGGAGDVSA